MAKKQYKYMNDKERHATLAGRFGLAARTKKAYLRDKQKETKCTKSFCCIPSMIVEISNNKELAMGMLSVLYDKAHSTTKKGKKK